MAKFIRYFKIINIALFFICLHFNSPSIRLENKEKRDMYIPMKPSTSPLNSPSINIENYAVLMRMMGISASFSNAVVETISAIPSISTSSRPSMLVESAEIDLSPFGCNTNPLSVSVSTVKNGYVMPCELFNCNETDSQMRIVSTFAVKEGSTVCMTFNNDTEISTEDNYKLSSPQVHVLNFKNMYSQYQVSEKYKIAVNIDIKSDCLCACPGGFSEVDCYKGVDFCKEKNQCINLQQTQYSDCLDSKLGWFGNPSRTCCNVEFNTYEVGTVYKITAKTYSRLQFDKQTYFSLDNDYTFKPKNVTVPDDCCGLGYTYETTEQNKTWSKGLQSYNNKTNDYLSTFPQGAYYYEPATEVVINDRTTYDFCDRDLKYSSLAHQLACYFVPGCDRISARENRIPGQSAGCDNFPVSVNFTLKSIGTFPSENFPGDTYLLEYKGEYYNLEDANGINEFDVTKFGWLKLDTNGKPIFDKNAVKRSAEMKVNSCLKGDVDVTYDLNPTITDKMMKFSDYTKKYGVPNLQDLEYGYMTFESQIEADTILELNTDVPFFTSSYTYGINNFNCTTRSTFLSTDLRCYINYKQGAKYLHYSIYNKLNKKLYESDVVTSGSGSEDVDIVIPASIIRTSSHICFQSNANVPKCMNFTLQGTGYNLTNPNWVEESNTTETTFSSFEDDGLSFNFFDWKTWEDNIMKTIVAFIILFLIIIVIVAVIASLIYFAPEIAIFYINYKHKFSNFKILNKKSDKDTKFNLLSENELSEY